jgi:hypothetical protein
MWPKGVLDLWHYIRGSPLFNWLSLARLVNPDAVHGETPLFFVRNPKFLEGSPSGSVKHCFVNPPPSAQGSW